MGSVKIYASFPHGMDALGPTRMKQSLYSYSDD